MIVLNTFWNKDYLQKRGKNGSQVCWVMTLKSSIKKGSKMLLHMHSQERMRNQDEEGFVCVSSIIQPYWITEASDEWKNYEEVWTLIQNFHQDPIIYDTIS